MYTCICSLLFLYKSNCVHTATWQKWITIEPPVYDCIHRICKYIFPYMNIPNAKRSFLWEPFNGSRGHIYDANYPYLYSHKSWRMIPYSVFAAGIKCNGEHNDWLKTFRLFLLGTLYNFLTFDIYFWSIWNKKKNIWYSSVIYAGYLV